MKNTFLRLVTCFFILFAIASCNNDDDNGFQQEPIRERGPQAILDDAKIVQFLKTHTYNKTDFEATVNQETSDLVFTKVTDESLSLFNESEETLKKIELEAGGIKQTVYVLIAKKGEGKQLADKSTNSYNVTYRGTHITDENDEVVFDERFKLIWLTNGNLIKGFAGAMSEFNAAQMITTASSKDITCNVKTVEFDDKGKALYTGQGIGAIFIPSGLGYFNVAQTNSSGTTIIPRYSNLIFKVSTVNVNFEKQEDCPGEM